MGIFNKLFSNKEKDQEPDIQFGRFSDAYKHEEKYIAWDQSIALFEEGQYLDSYRKFFEYLTDEHIQNVQVKDEEGKLYFTLHQGSKTIKGVASNASVKAEAKIATVKQMHIGFLRKLLDENFELKYCRYAFDSNRRICAVFSSNSIDGSPYKLYYAIKELATHADKTDDLLVQEFSGLQHIDNEHINPINKRTKSIMYDFVQQRVKEVVQCVDHPALSMTQYPGAESYLYLDLLYGIDYLTKPEGNTMKKIEDVHQWYFNEKVLSPIQKNQKIRIVVEEIKSTSLESFDKELYRVKSTFGITQQSGQDRIQRFIEGELDNMDWYCQEGHEQVALSVPGFIVGYCLYNYSMPIPLRKLFQLYYRVIHNDYFAALGFESLKDHKKLHTKKIKQHIKSIIEKHASTYSELKFDFKELQFDDLCLFAKSYLLAVKSLDFSRTDLM